ncbi:DUF433 domain-containing protein [Neolewinella maritima]|uniref:DUF433 domain-containing protein n=1 Tax=Neolewinella maritima TaxID=1383882 RepID=UPI001EE8A7A0|nr:DUF433 domain-containing protein [Neolewinella maritima]
MNYRERIHSDPNVMLGKPVIKNTRIAVEHILQKMADGYSSVDLVGMYPGLEQVDIDACLNYAAAVVASEEIIKAA